MKAKITARMVGSLQPQNNIFAVRDTEIKGFLLKVSPTGGMVYYLDYRNRDGGRQSYKIGRAGNLTPIQARDIASQLAADVIHGKDIQLEKKHNKQQHQQNKLKTLRAFIENKYKQWVIVEKKWGEGTVNRICLNFSWLLDRPMCEIDVNTIENWRAERAKKDKTGKELKDKKKSASTINRDIASLRSALTKAVEWKIIDKHPLAGLKPLKTDDNAKIRYLSSDEESRLRSALDERQRKLVNQRVSANTWRKERRHPLKPDLSKVTYPDHLKPMFLLSINTGIRQGELFKLRWENVDFANRLLTIAGSTAKTQKTRHIPLNEEAYTVLTEWKKQESKSVLVFTGKNNEPFNNVKKSWANLLKSAQLAFPSDHPLHFRWHDIRHTFASKLVMKGVDLYVVKTLMGHSSIKMTERYAHLSPGHLKKAVEKLRFEESSNMQL